MADVLAVPREVPQPQQPCARHPCPCTAQLSEIPAHPLSCSSSFHSPLPLWLLPRTGILHNLLMDLAQGRFAKAQMGDGISLPVAVDTQNFPWTGGSTNILQHPHRVLCTHLLALPRESSGLQPPRMGCCTQKLACLSQGKEPKKRPLLSHSNLTLGTSKVLQKYKTWISVCVPLGCFSSPSATVRGSLGCEVKQHQHGRGCSRRILRSLPNHSMIL